MKRLKNQRSWIVSAAALATLMLAGCGSVGGTASDVGLAGAGGVAGYHLSGGHLGGAAAGAAVGLIGSRVAQAEVQRGMNDAEKRGYDRAMNQAVKQQYWLIQAQQRTRQEPEAPDSRLVPVTISETTINGVTQNARVEYIRVTP